MSEVVAFKSGKDLAPEGDLAEDDGVACSDCGTRASDERAYVEGWQLDPPVCPQCLRWVATDACCQAVPEVRNAQH
ncbi:MAG TPA: hypothetical protein VEK11_01050 [Thermoanaerobaculia bacterium]|nr:hypothetical protein [Thermoanaerobaculia bacterium]